MPQDEIDKIETALKFQNESAVILASYLTQLAGWNSYYTEQLKKIQLVKPAKWLEIQRRDEQLKVMKDKNVVAASITSFELKPLSDKKTEMTWAATEDGQKETALTYELKRIDILYRSISKRLSAIENDFRMSRSQV